MEMSEIKQTAKKGLPVFANGIHYSRIVEITAFYKEIDGKIVAGTNVGLLDNGKNCIVVVQPEAIRADEMYADKSVDEV